MGASGPAGKRGAISEINVTPLVDVVLVLLIIFMVVGDLLAEESTEGAIPIDLPEASTGDSSKDTQDKPFAVAVDKEGQFIIRGERLTDAELVARIEVELKARGEDMEVILSKIKLSTHSFY